MGLLDTLALAGIALDQRWISPHKGFCCAHAAVYGGASCSASIAQVIRGDGLNLSAIAARFVACRQAYVDPQVTGRPRVRGMCCCVALPIPFHCV
ncbi:membrane protein insertion efficiency factor YidD [Deinococcus marmoris]|uniref:membrane protein insertion efficiency factor YidD n=1 Tax=Deinococcus marmoris TaxID=249408 RepID=UPI0004980DAD|nr:membrane protein insertion efficiency factor YidD [Deinococcus marmoris]